MFVGLLVCLVGRFVGGLAGWLGVLSSFVCLFVGLLASCLFVCLCDGLVWLSLVWFCFVWFGLLGVFFVFFARFV